MPGTKKENITIRRMTRDDIDAVLLLDRKIGGGKSSMTYRDMIVTDPGGPLDLSFVAQTGDKIIGFLLAKLVYVYIPLSEVCLIHGTVVDPKYQGSHIGSKLFNHLFDHCQLEDIYTVRALVSDNDTDLRRFVEHLGFHRSKIINYDKTFES
jgi:ribosomal protein S18 acetylase RimI-like enzyme